MAMLALSASVADQLPGPLALEQRALLDGIGHDAGRHRVAGGADPLGEPHHDLERGRAAIARGRADQGHDLVLRPLDRLDLTDRAAERAAGAEREHGRLPRREMRFELPGGGGAEAEHAVLVGIAGHDLGVVELEAGPERLLELGAGAQRVIDPERDQALGDRGRDQPLRGLARDVELARELVLGVAGDVVEPGCADRQIAPAVLGPQAGELPGVASIEHRPQLRQLRNRTYDKAAPPIKAWRRSGSRTRGRTDWSAQAPGATSIAIRS